MKARLKQLILTVAAFGIGGSGTAKAAVIGYLSNLVGPTDTEVNYTLTLQKFNPTLGTLTGVKIYFYAEEDVAHLTLQNISGSATQNYGASATANFVAGMTNSATTADKYSALLETVAFFDTGISSAIGNCTSNGAPAVRPNQCSNLTFTPGQTVDYGPFTFANTDALFMNDPDQVLTKGTGVQGLTGVIKNGTSISNYVGAGTWNLSGATINTLSLSNGGGNINFTQQTQAQFRAEVDYTYTASATPEPATMSLMGGSLLGAILLRKRLKKS